MVSYLDSVNSVTSVNIVNIFLVVYHEWDYSNEEVDLYKALLTSILDSGTFVLLSSQTLL